MTNQVVKKIILKSKHLEDFCFLFNIIFVLANQPCFYVPNIKSNFECDLFLLNYRATKAKMPIFAHILLFLLQKIALKYPEVFRSSFDTFK